MSRIVVKIGSNILAGKNKGLSYSRIRTIARDVSGICDEGNEVLIVSSGAVAAGMKKLGLSEKPTDICLKQAAAAVGQSSLMWSYEKGFGCCRRLVGQVLLTRMIFSYRATYLNARNTILTLLSRGIIPIINENDTVAIDEIKFGDNDQLAALVSGLIGADRLIILSDVDGLYDSDPKRNSGAVIIRTVSDVTPELETTAGSAGSIYGTGGMYSKILAAKKAMSYGVRVTIINGKKTHLISGLLRGEHHGTEFIPRLHRVSSRKGWIAYAVKPKGTIAIDRGAARAILMHGRSLLPSGIVMVEGDFETGDAVHCVDPCGTRIAKGIVNYSSRDIDRIMGKQTSEIEGILGFKYSDEVVHRDNLVVVERGVAL